jgi:hypothetical protein
MNRLRLEQLKEKLDRLDADEHAQIFAIVKRHTETFTKTQTGAFVSSESLPVECIEEMEKMVLFYIDQRKDMDLSRRQ